MATITKPKTKPAVVVLGYGSHDALHLTVEAQRILERTGRACALGIPPLLARHLKSLRVKVEDLTVRFGGDRAYADFYLDAADYVLERAQVEQPVVLLTPGNPLFLNSVTRFLVLEGRRRDMRIDIHPGVSPLDVLVSYLGVDVAQRGLQVFTADQLLTQGHLVNSRVPLFLMELAGLGASRLGQAGVNPNRFRRLMGHLAGFYPPQHPTTLVNLTSVPGRRSHATVPLARLDEFLAHLTTDSCLFVDALVTEQRKET